jgi:hypothetical protein
MPDTKITALAAITTVDPAADVLPIVDISDTSMAASGTTKKVTINQILGASGTATLASATITGNLTAARLIVTGGTIPTNGLWLPTTNTLEFAANSLAQHRIAPLGVFSWFDGAGGTRMTLNATGLGVGVVPSYKLDVEGADNSIIAQFGGTSRKVNFTTSANGANANGYFNFVSTSIVGAFSFQNGSGTHLTIDSSGNVGIGVGTFGTSAAKVLAIGTGTEPTTGPAGSVQFFTSTRSASNTIPAIFCEGSGVTNAGITSTTVTNKIAIKVNGTIYYLLATTSAA